jgi:hypothetical protein
MASVLFLGNGKYLTVDRIWQDNGQDPEYVLQGGQKVLISKGSRARATIAQKGAQFVYMNGKPVDKIEDVDWLPEPFRTTAIRFVKEAQASDKPVEVVLHDEKIDALVEAATPRKRGRGRPRKGDEPKVKKLEIKDDESLDMAIRGELK